MKKTLFLSLLALTTCNITVSSSETQPTNANQEAAANQLLSLLKRPNRALSREFFLNLQANVQEFLKEQPEDFFKGHILDHQTAAMLFINTQNSGVLLSCLKQGRTFDLVTPSIKKSKQLNTYCITNVCSSLLHKINPHFIADKEPSCRIANDRALLWYLRRKFELLLDIRPSWDSQTPRRLIYEMGLWDELDLPRPIIITYQLASQAPSVVAHNPYAQPSQETNQGALQ